jgi:hypothetical protein
LDVSIFAPLATAYKAGVLAKGRWGATYSIDKVDFLQIYQQARLEAITTKNIQSAWEKIGLFPFNPKVVLQELPSNKIALVPKPPSQPLSRPTTPGLSAPLSNATPGNIEAVKGILKEIQGAEVELEVIVYRFKKVASACIQAITQSQLSYATNVELIEAAKRKKSRGDRSGEIIGSDARVLNKAGLEAIEKIKAGEVAKKRLKKQHVSWVRLEKQTITQFSKYGPGLFGTFKPPSLRKQASKACPGTQTPSALKTPTAPEREFPKYLRFLTLQYYIR